MSGNEFKQDVVRKQVLFCVEIFACYDAHFEIGIDNMFNEGSNNWLIGQIT